MLRLLGITALAFVSVSSSAADVGVSVNVDVPGAYGRIDLGGYPPPRVVYPQPVYVQRDPSGPPPPPVYLHVPPGHAKNWRKHCREYDACGRPVYFVQEDWYRDVYAPRYQQRQHGGDDRHDDRRGEGRDDRRDDGRHDNGRRGDRPDEDRGRDKH